MKPNIATPLIALMLMLAFSCGSPCKEDGTSNTVNEDRFGPSYSAIMPYTGNDTLYYLKNGIDTIVLYGTGKKEYYEEVFRGEGDCLVKYRLLNHKVDFVNQQTQRILGIHYYRYSETTAFRDFFNIEFNNTYVIKEHDVSGMYFSSSGKLINILILGVGYNNTLPVTNGFDSIYLCGPEPKQQIVRIRHQNDIYEVIP